MLSRGEGSRCDSWSSVATVTSRPSGREVPTAAAWWSRRSGRSLVRVHFGRQPLLEQEARRAQPQRTAGAAGLSGAAPSVVLALPLWLSSPRPHTRLARRRAASSPSFPAPPEPGLGCPGHGVRSYSEKDSGFRPAAEPGVPEAEAVRSFVGSSVGRSLRAASTATAAAAPSAASPWKSLRWSRPPSATSLPASPQNKFYTT